MNKSSSANDSENIAENKIPIHKTENKENKKGPLILPKKVPYLIIGGGTASWPAFRAIKDLVPNAKVLVVSNETYLPYMRPKLSKDMWLSGTNCAQNFPVDRIYFEPSDFYTDPMQLFNESNGGVSILNRTAKYLRLCERKVVLTDGTEIEYDECLLATGSKPRNLLIFQTAPLRIRNKISFFRSLKDFQSVKDIVDQSESVAVIGGGFLATEISLALTTYAASTIQLKVYQIFHENGNMGMALPSVGLVDSTLKTVGIFSNGSSVTTNINNTNKGVVFYIKNDEVVGILLWNIFDKINIARQVIAEGKKLNDLNEVAKRFEI